MQKEKLNRKNNGITLIALIITIIVMLILVGVSVTVALNGGLFSAAKTAKDNTILERDRDLELADGRIKVGETWYDSLEAYKQKIPSSNQQDTPGTGNGTATEYTLGTEVTIGETGENFYVIKDEGENLVLLAKNSIDETTFEYAPESYWSTHNGTYPLDLNEYGVFPEGTAIDIAKEYAEEITGNRDNGRLMTLGEIQELGVQEGDLTDDCPNFLKTAGSFWLSTANGASRVWFIANWSSTGYGSRKLHIDNERVQHQ